MRFPIRPLLAGIFMSALVLGCGEEKRPPPASEGTVIPKEAGDHKAIPPKTPGKKGPPPAPE